MAGRIAVIGPFDSYEELWRWSVDDIAGFWAAVWDFFEVQSSVPYTEMLDSPTMPGTQVVRSALD